MAIDIKSILLLKIIQMKKKFTKEKIKLGPLKLKLSL